MDRAIALERITGGGPPWDIVVVGGGASGLGVAVDAASRGYRTLLLEARDFGSGTSSRSTKLIHGGVRYLRQGRVGLVRSALEERARLLANAPGLVGPLEFVVPAYRRRDLAAVRLGLWLYDRLAGGTGAPSRGLDPAAVRSLVPGVRAAGLKGAVAYEDARFDDARLAVALARTAWREGAVVVNHMEVTAFAAGGGDAAVTVHAVDRENGGTFEIPARVVVNCAGPFVDRIRALAAPEARPMLRPSRGTHLVLDRSAYPGTTALLIPDAGDGRVVFLIPWRDRVLLGTTDVAVAAADAEPRATRAEAEALLELAGRALERRPAASEVRSVFAGLRPLLAGDGRTASLPRDHEVRREHGWLITLDGGKWTTYRRMAEDAVGRAAAAAGLPARACRTATLPLARTDAAEGGEAEVLRAVREEMARTVEDVLARRTHALVTDAAAARAAAPRTAAILARELGQDAAWEAAQVESFGRLAATREFAGLA